MAFIFTLSAASNAGVPVEGNGECLARVPIGYDDATGEVFSLLAALSPLPTGGVEFIFLLTKVCPQSGDITEYWDGLQTKSFCPAPEHRSLIFEELCEMLLFLVERSQADTIMIVTHASDLPPQALVKYQKFMALLKSAGYAGGRVDQWHGKRMWIAFR